MQRKFIGVVAGFDAAVGIYKTGATHQMYRLTVFDDGLQAHERLENRWTIVATDRGKAKILNANGRTR